MFRICSAYRTSPTKRNDFIGSAECERCGCCSGIIPPLLSLIIVAIGIYKVGYPTHNEIVQVVVPCAPRIVDATGQAIRLHIYRESLVELTQNFALILTLAVAKDLISGDQVAFQHLWRALCRPFSANAVKPVLSDLNALGDRFPQVERRVVECLLSNYVLAAGNFTHFVPIDMIRDNDVTQADSVATTYSTGYSGKDDKLGPEELSNVPDQIATWRVATVRTLCKNHIIDAWTQLLPAKVRCISNQFSEIPAITDSRVLFVDDGDDSNQCIANPTRQTDPVRYGARLKI